MIWLLKPGEVLATLFCKGMDGSIFWCLVNLSNVFIVPSLKFEFLSFGTFEVDFKFLELMPLLLFM